MQELTVTQTDLIADYADGSGRYRIYRQGDLLVTVWGEDETGREDLVQRLTRAPQFDADDASIDLLVSDWMLTERFGSSPDFGDDGVVWIDGAAYLSAWPTRDEPNDGFEVVIAETAPIEAVEVEVPVEVAAPTLDRIAEVTVADMDGWQVTVSRLPGGDVTIKVDDTEDTFMTAVLSSTAWTEITHAIGH